jgi:hypothetical protein
VKHSLRMTLVTMLLAAEVSSYPVSERAMAQDSDQELPDATLRISGTLLAAGVGYKWGRGTLDYQGQELKFCIHGRFCRTNAA